MNVYPPLLYFHLYVSHSFILYYLFHNELLIFLLSWLYIPFAQRVSSKFIIWFSFSFFVPNFPFTLWLHSFSLLHLQSQSTLTNRRGLQLFRNLIFRFFEIQIRSINALSSCWCKSLSLWQNKLKIKMFIVVHSPLSISQCNRRQREQQRKQFVHHLDIWCDTFRVHKHKDVNGEGSEKRNCRKISQEMYIFRTDWIWNISNALH